MRRDMNRAIASFATLILLLPAAASPVLAQDTAQSEEDTPRLHFFYLGGGLALGEYLEVEDDLKPIFAPFKVKAKETVGTDVRVGYRMAARFGGGVDVYVTNRLGIYLDVTYLMATGDVEGLDHVGLSLGALFRFY